MLFYRRDGSGLLLFDHWRDRSCKLFIIYWRDGPGLLMLLSDRRDSSGMFVVNWRDRSGMFVVNWRDRSGMFVVNWRCWSRWSFLFRICLVGSNRPGRGDRVRIV